MCSNFGTVRLWAIRDSTKGKAMKPHQILQKIMFVLLILAARHLVAQGNLVVNGGFDTDASGWMLTNGAAYADSKGDPGGWVGLNSGTGPAPISLNPTASQIINGLVPDQTYSISGDLKKTIDWSGGTLTGLSFGVAIDGNYLYEAADPGNFDWQNFSFFYTATSSSIILSLTSQLNGTEVSYGIDNISIYAMPEPSPSWLLLLGSGIFFYARRMLHR